MLKCEICGTGVLEDDNFCVSCGANLYLQVNHLATHWNDGIDESITIHWLAQCQRRLLFPIEQTEEIPFVAFEYGWKVLNRIYDLADAPPSGSRFDGEPRVVNRIISVLSSYELIGDTIDKNKDLILKLCDCVLEKRDEAFLGGTRGTITLEDAPASAQRVKNTATELCKTLETAVDGGEYEAAAIALLKILYGVRNVRVHAALPKEAKSVLRQGDSVPRYRTQGAALRANTQEVFFLTEIILSIGKALVGAKASLSQPELELLIRSRIGQLCKDITRRVAAWRSPNSPLSGGEISASEHERLKILLANAHLEIDRLNRAP